MHPFSSSWNTYLDLPEHNQPFFSSFIAENPHIFDKYYILVTLATHAWVNRIALRFWRVTADKVISL